MAERTHDQDRAVARLTGADIELGGLILGPHSPVNNGGNAARAVLAEITGVSRTPIVRYEEQWPDTAYPSDGYREFTTASAATSTVSQGYQEWGQDRGRKFLGNGGCAYIDMDHLEIALPETLGAFDHVAAHSAMLRIVREALGRANDRQPPGRTIKLMVNNGNGTSSWGSHLNVLLSRRAWNHLISERLHYTAFLASFQNASILLTGAGKVGADRGEPVRYQISARADWIGDGGMISTSTIADRPLVNSRDESLTGPSSGLARLHCIFYDSTLCQTATLLRVGLMQVVTAMIEQEEVPARLILDDPIAALHTWSRDPELKATAKLMDGSQFSATDFLEAIHDRASRFVAAGRADGIVPEVRRIMEIFDRCLGALRQRDLHFLASRIDWVAKLRVLDSAAATHGVAWGSPQMRYLDFAYSGLGAEGLYMGLERARAVEKLVSDAAVEKFVHEPPEDTRAWLRGYVIRHAEPGMLDDVDWNRLWLRHQRTSRHGWTNYSYTDFPLPDPLRFTRRDCEAVLQSAPTLEEGLRRLAQLNDELITASDAPLPIAVMSKQQS